MHTHHINRGTYQVRTVSYQYKVIHTILFGLALLKSVNYKYSYLYILFETDIYYNKNCSIRYHNTHFHRIFQSKLYSQLIHRSRSIYNMV